MSKDTVFYEAFIVDLSCWGDQLPDPNDKSGHSSAWRLNHNPRLQIASLSSIHPLIQTLQRDSTKVATGSHFSHPLIKAIFGGIDNVERKHPSADKRSV